MKIILPDNLNTLREMTNYVNNLYLVGGSSRDLLLGLNIKDIDITGSILPEKFKEIFGGNITNKLGTVFTSYKGIKIEYTPFRTEGNYNGRKPDNIIFTDNIEEDAKRRDFTINSIYINLDTLDIVDLNNGIIDLKLKNIKCIGSTKDRFEEDILRILRAIRFSFQLGFNIDKEIDEYIRLNYKQIKKLSNFRIKEELLKGIQYYGYIEKLLEYGILQMFFPEFIEMNGLNNNSKFHKYDVLKHSLQSLKTGIKKFKIKDSLLLLSILLHDIGKPKQFYESRKYEIGSEDFRIAIRKFAHNKIGCEIAEKRLKDLSFSNTEIKYIKYMIKLHKDVSLYNPNRKNVKKLLLESSLYQEKYINDLLLLAMCDRYGTGTRTISEVKNINYTINYYINLIKKDNECLKLKDLKINGNDLIELGFNGKEIGVILNNMLEIVIKDNTKNNKKILISIIKSTYS